MMIKRGVRVRLGNKRLAAIALVMGLLVIGGQFVSRPVSAAPNDVVINELAYNPGDGNQNNEFIELRNNTGSTVDLNGWCFTSGVNLCFGSGMTISANGYVVVSPNIAATEAGYGVTPIATYTGNLSNSGETVTLRDGTSAVVNSVTYSDSRPWPITPDGTGPSLELNDPYGNNSDPENWGAALPDDLQPEKVYTPAEENSIFDSGVPILRDITDPNDVSASTGVGITVRVEGSGITNVNLIHKVNFDADEAPIEMFDDGNHNDGAASDGTYGASIPGQASGDLVRFRIEATNANGTTEAPRYDDTIDYFGYYISTNPSTNAEVLEWFIDEADYTDLLTNHVGDEVYVPAVFAYGDNVYDNSQVRIKGEYSLTFPKKSYKFKLPKNYKVSFDWDNNDSAQPIDEFHLNSDYTTQSIGRAPTAWWAAERIGMPVPDYAVARLQKNSQFEGLYILIDKYESEWRDTNNFDNGPLYEDFGEIVDGVSDLVPINAWRSDMQRDRRDPDKRGHILDQNNIPAMITYMTTRAIVANHDTSMETNTFSYKSNTTDRWEFLFWDMDLLFQQDTKSISPYDTPYFFDLGASFTTNAIYDQQDLRQAFFRRLRTMADELHASGDFLEKFQEVNTTHDADINLDINKWPDEVGFTRIPIANDEQAIRNMFYNYYAFIKTPWGDGMPAAQTDTERQQVSIAQVVSSNTNSDEYIRLSNASTAAVDMSGWVMEGINYTLPAGSVIPAGGSMYLLRDDKGYKASHDPVLVAGQYSNDLGSVAGTFLRLRTANNLEIDTYDY